MGRRQRRKKGRIASSVAALSPEAEALSSGASFVDAESAARVARQVDAESILGPGAGSTLVKAATKGAPKASRFMRGLGVAGGALTAGFAVKDIADLVHYRKLADRIDAQPDVQPEDILREIRQGELAALREASLARNDPEAYRILNDTMQGRKQPPALLSGEMLLGSPPRNSIRSSSDPDIGSLLEALSTS